MRGGVKASGAMQMVTMLIQQWRIGEYCGYHVGCHAWLHGGIDDALLLVLFVISFSKHGLGCRSCIIYCPFSVIPLEIAFRACRPLLTILRGPLYLGIYPLRLTYGPVWVLFDNLLFTSLTGWQTHPYLCFRKHLCKVYLLLLTSSFSLGILHFISKKAANSGSFKTASVDKFWKDSSSDSRYFMIAVNIFQGYWSVFPE